MDHQIKFNRFGIYDKCSFFVFLLYILLSAGLEAQLGWHGGAMVSTITLQQYGALHFCPTECQGSLFVQSLHVLSMTVVEQICFRRNRLIQAQQKHFFIIIFQYTGNTV